MNKLFMRVAVMLVTCLAILPQWVLASSDFTQKGYKLEQVLMVSRHNMRAPLAGKGSVIEQSTPYKWHQWEVPAGYLTLKGGVAETIMGQYFRLYLMDEGFMPNNWIPEPDQVRIYANSYQRTIATSKYFSAGLLPCANITVEFHMGINQKDPVFLPSEQLSSPEQLAKAEAYERQRYIPMQELQQWYNTLARFIDFSQSPYALQHGLKGFNVGNYHWGVKNNHIKRYGDIETFGSVADAMVMQYYEVADDKTAAFGHEGTQSDWDAVGDILVWKMDIAQRNPVMALKTTVPLLKVMDQELNTPNRKFTMLTCHDTNLSRLTKVLDVEPYKLPGAIQNQTTIGSKIVIEKRRGQDGKAYADVAMVYASDQQLRHLEILNLENPAKRVPLQLKGLKRNQDGLYLYDEVQQRLKTLVEGNRK